MTIYEKLVAEFQEATGCAQPKVPTIIDEGLFDFRIRLLLEEIGELKDAFYDKDVVEIADAFADIEYILAGTKDAMGFSQSAKECYEEVHSSNMTKFFLSEEEAQSKLAEVKEKYGDDCEIASNGKFFSIVRGEDGKVLKCESTYRPANLLPILEKYKK